MLEVSQIDYIKGGVSQTHQTLTDEKPRDVQPIRCNAYMRTSASYTHRHIAHTNMLTTRHIFDSFYHAVAVGRPLHHFPTNECVNHTRKHSANSVEYNCIFILI